MVGKLKSKLTLREITLTMPPLPLPTKIFLHHLISCKFNVSDLTKGGQMHFEQFSQLDKSCNFFTISDESVFNILLS
jgi:hypothetical protein